jgi:hypothetical protein
MEVTFLKILNQTAKGFSLGVLLCLSACFGSSPQGGALPVPGPGGLGAAPPGAATPPPSSPDDANNNPPNDPGTPEVASRTLPGGVDFAQPFGGQRPTPNVDLGDDFRYLVTSLAEPLCSGGQAMALHITGQIAKPDPTDPPFGTISTEECNGRILRVVNLKTSHYKDEMTKKDPTTGKNCFYEITMSVDASPSLAFLVGKAGVTSTPLDKEPELPCGSSHCEISSDFEAAFRDTPLLDLASYFAKGETPCGTDFRHYSQFQPTFVPLTPEKDLQLDQAIDNFNKAPDTTIR